MPNDSSTTPAVLTPSAALTPAVQRVIFTHLKNELSRINNSINPQSPFKLSIDGLDNRIDALNTDTLSSNGHAQIRSISIRIQLQILKLQARWAGHVMQKLANHLEDDTLSQILTRHRTGNIINYIDQLEDQLPSTLGESGMARFANELQRVGTETTKAQSFADQWWKLTQGCDPSPTAPSFYLPRPS